MALNCNVGEGGFRECVGVMFEVTGRRVFFSLIVIVDCCTLVGWLL